MTLTTPMKRPKPNMRARSAAVPSPAWTSRDAVIFCACWNLAVLRLAFMSPAPWKDNIGAS